MQYRRQMRETGESNSYWQLAPLFTQHFTPRNSWEVIVMLWSEERKNHNLHHRCICVTCKSEKQLIRDVSCTENWFP